jgi:hypothetical protein
MEIEAVLSNLFAVNAVLVEDVGITRVMTILNVGVFVMAIILDALVAFFDVVQFIIKTFHAAPFTRLCVVNSNSHHRSPARSVHRFTLGS